MSTYPINTAIPAANNAPADDQPQMQSNFNNINGYLQVDHTNPAAAGAGEHQQVTFFSNKSTTSIPANSVGILYPGAGTAVPASTQLYYLNNNTPLSLPISAIRAYAVFSTGVGAPTLIASYNCVSVNFGASLYNLVLNANAVPGGTTPAILWNQSAVTVNPGGYTFVNPTITFTGIANNTIVSVLVVQI